MDAAPIPLLQRGYGAAQSLYKKEVRATFMVCIFGYHGDSASTGGVWKRGVEVSNFHSPV